MKLSDLERVKTIQYEIEQKESFIKDFSSKPTCIATNYLDSRPEKLLRIETNLKNAIAAELEKQIDELKNQLKELGVEVDE